MRVISAILATLLAGLFLAAQAARAEDEPVNIITFETRDGKKFQGLNYSAFNSGELKTYILTTLDGKKAMLLDKDIASRTQELVALADLKEDARKDVLRSRAAAAAAKAESDARAAEQKLTAAAKRSENEARGAYARAREDLATAESVLAGAEGIVKNAPIETAKADARYDASKTELSTPAIPVYGGGTNVRRADYLREQMKKAAEDKARIEAGRKDAEDVIKRTHENIRVFEARAEAARKALEAAEAETRKAIEKIKAPRERADVDFSIRKNPETNVETK